MVTLTQLETQKQDLLSFVLDWPEERLLYRPSTEGWCAAQVFDHLVKTEERILEAAKRGSSKPHRIGMADRARTLFLRKVFESDRRVKVPPSAALVLPSNDPNMDEVKQRWTAVRVDLASFSTGLSATEMRQGIFKHPVGGWMAISDVVEFFHVHMLHHVFQLSRLSAESQSL